MGKLITYATAKTIGNDFAGSLTNKELLTINKRFKKLAVNITADAKTSSEKDYWHVCALNLLLEKPINAFLMAAIDNEHYRCISSIMVGCKIALGYFEWIPPVEKTKKGKTYTTGGRWGVSKDNFCRATEKLINRSALEVILVKWSTTKPSTKLGQLLTKLNFAKVKVNGEAKSDFRFNKTGNLVCPSSLRSPMLTDPANPKEETPNTSKLLIPCSNPTLIKLGKDKHPKSDFGKKFVNNLISDTTLNKAKRGAQQAHIKKMNTAMGKKRSTSIVGVESGIKKDDGTLFPGLKKAHDPDNDDAFNLRNMTWLRIISPLVINTIEMLKLDPNFKVGLKKDDLCHDLLPIIVKMIQTEAKKQRDNDNAS